jgi:AcrR family transcriptional regulator
VKDGAKLLARSGENHTRGGGRSARVVHEVLRATADELGRVGYAALRVEDVAQHADVNKTTIYRRWPTKADLVTAALQHDGDQCIEAPDTGSVRGDLLFMLRRFAEHSRTPIVRMMMVELSHPEVQAIAAGLKRNFQAEWVRVIARAMARGELPAGTSPLLLTEVITATVVGRVMRGEQAPDEVFCEAVVDLVLAGAMGVAEMRRPRAKTG